MTHAGTFALAAARRSARCSPHCVVGRVQVDGLRGEGEGSLTPLVLLQEGPEVVVNIRDWNDKTQLLVLGLSGASQLTALRRCSRR